jgi:hypothetical protein
MSHSAPVAQAPARLFRQFLGRRFAFVTEFFYKRGGNDENDKNSASIEWCYGGMPRPWRLSR